MSGKRSPDSRRDPRRCRRRPWRLKFQQASNNPLAPMPPPTHMLTMP